MKAQDPEMDQSNHYAKEKYERTELYRSISVPERYTWHFKVSVPELTWNQSIHPVNKYLAMLVFQILFFLFRGKNNFEVTSSLNLEFLKRGKLHIRFVRLILLDITILIV